MQQQKLMGGGIKKVLYTLKTAQKMGWRASAKALTAHNACKACGLGMGGQRGGMTNELGEFPSVCNKSVQAQSTDLQAPIPLAIFNHPLSELQELTGREVESLGRLNTPLYKRAQSDTFEPMSWADALSLCGSKFKASRPERTFFYASGRSSNEAGFVLQLLARAMGTNHVNNCSYFCHQATGVALQNAIGSGTATVQLHDLSHSDLIFVIGANPASNHPRLIHNLKACRDRGGKVVVINPVKEPGLVRFSLPKSASSLLAGGHEIASHYIQPKVGSDTYLLAGMAKTVIASNAANTEFIQQHTVQVERYIAQLQALSWDAIAEKTGLAQTAIEAIATLYIQAENAIFTWGMGLTHHTHGVENIESLVNLALLRGMIGKPGAGLLPLRGHSNVQGMGTVGVKPVLPQDIITAFEKQLGISTPQTKGMDTMACLAAAHAGKIDAALIMGGNLLEAAPATTWAKQALDRIGFKLHLTTTLNRGHLHGSDTSETLILPVTARDEEWQPTTQESMFSYVRLSDGGIERLDNVRPEVDILATLGSQIVPPEVFDFLAFLHHATIRSAIAHTIEGMEKLADIDTTKTEFHIGKRHLNQSTFPTMDGHGHFLSIDFPKAPSTAEFPLTLISARSEGQFNTIIYEEHDSYRGMAQRNVIMMNRVDMKNLDLIDGDSIRISSSTDSLDHFLVYGFDLAQGAVLGYYPETNPLVGLQLDPRSQTPAYKSVPVAVRKMRP